MAESEEQKIPWGDVVNEMSGSKTSEEIWSEIWSSMSKQLEPVLLQMEKDQAKAWGRSLVLWVN